MLSIFSGSYQYYISSAVKYLVNLPHVKKKSDYLSLYY